MRLAKILHNSTHEALEYDDVKFFTSMRHTVFSVGKFRPAHQQDLGYRDPIDYPESVMKLVELFLEEGCSCAFMGTNNTNLTPRLLNTFDYIISIQDLDFFKKFWDQIEGPVAVWRTVGQGIDHFDEIARPFREKGMKIVRWSDREQFAHVYIGHDAIIRAYKDQNEYHSWTGDNKKIITFANGYRQRYPIEFGLFERVCGLLDYGIGGAGNEGARNAMGLLSFEAMKSEYRGAGAYFYMHGTVVPYTLNFVEAWMTGVPIVAAARNVQIGNIDMRFNEINDLIMHGQNGFLFKSEAQAKGILMNLLLDRPYAAMIGANGRNMAARIFSRDRAAADWTCFFDAHRPR